MKSPLGRFLAQARIRAEFAIARLNGLRMALMFARRMSIVLLSSSEKNRPLNVRATNPSPLLRSQSNATASSSPSVTELFSIMAFAMTADMDM